MKNNFKSLFSAAVIPVALVVAVLVFMFVMGSSTNFQGGSSENQPLPGNYLGTIYKGGFIVPILMTCLLVVITFSIERFYTIRKASGTGSVMLFVTKVKGFLAQGDMKSAYSECEKQQGSVANVVSATLMRYEMLEKEEHMTKEQKLLDIQKNIEEATSLELPSLEQNLVILATLTSASTLLGLLGTVMGMIRSFAAMATAGSPDSTALATGISEALINTAFGIGTATIAVIAYNFFTTKIDKLTYSIDEAGYSIVQTYASTH